MNNILISISGLDGAGKTSVINELKNMALLKNIPITYVWGSYELILLKPIVKMGQKTFLNTQDRMTNYNEYYNSITKFSKKLLLSKSFEYLVLMEYLIQIFFKIWLPHKISKKVIICDRYYYDVLVYLAVTLRYSNEDIKRKSTLLKKLCPSPTHSFFLNIPAEIALSRKNDIPSLEYLTQRQNLYLYLANENKMEILDGTKEINENAKAIFSKFFEVD